MNEKGPTDFGKSLLIETRAVVVANRLCSSIHVGNALNFSGVVFLQRHLLWD